MENITLGQIAKVLAFIVALIGSIAYLKKALISALNKLLEPIKKEIKKNNLSNTKTNLINFMELADKKEISSEQKLISYELYDDYCQHGGNSFVHDKWEKLKKEGKL
jgi:hypothetical protein